MNVIHFPPPRSLLPPPPVAAPQSTILIVDDDPSVRSLLRYILIHRKFVVATAASGREALAVLAARPFDLVITDYNMPGMTGLHLARQVRQGRGKPPVIMVSGELSPEVVAHPESFDLAGVLSKPFTTLALLSVVDRVLAVSRAHPADARLVHLPPPVGPLNAQPRRNWGINE
jgi:CheY-like chemotaxis protein